MSSNPSSSSAGQESPRADSSFRTPARPQYMTVGSGSTSEHAARLQAMLDEDSGYGGSIAGGDSFARGWDPSLTEDRFTPVSTPGRPGEQNVTCMWMIEFTYADFRLTMTLKPTTRGEPSLAIFTNSTTTRTELPLVAQSIRRSRP